MTDKEILDELEQIKIEIREIKSGLASAMTKLNSIQTNHNSPNPHDIICIDSVVE